MKGGFRISRVLLFIAIICFLVALLPVTGLILPGDLTGCIIFTVVWIALGVFWVGQHLSALKRINQSEKGK